MSDSRATDSIFGLFLRIYWMMLGNAVLAIVVAFLVFRPEIPALLLLAVYGFAVLSLPVARFVDIRYCDGRTADGRPADLAHWSRYVRILVPSALALFGMVWGLRFFVGRVV
jgi:hypothetical protein